MSPATVSIGFGQKKIVLIVGTSIGLALNVKSDQKGTISPDTYLILIALQCLGLPLAFLVSSVNKLIRTDGTRPTVARGTTITERFRGFWRVCTRPEFAALAPIFLTSQWALAY